jgi:hypothetical protein
MNKYTFVDHNLDGEITIPGISSMRMKGKVIFTCVCNSQLEADEKFLKEVGIKPDKFSYIGCSSEKVEQ